MAYKQRTLINKSFENINGENFYVYQYEVITKKGKKSIYTYYRNYTPKGNSTIKRIYRTKTEENIKIPKHEISSDF